MSEYLPKYCMEVTHNDPLKGAQATQFIARAESPEQALKLARQVYTGRTVLISAPVRLCVHPLDALVHADAHTSSARRAERVYQCKQCGDYISVKIAV